VTKPHIREPLQGLSGGTIPLTHRGLDTFGRRRCADHMRGLLVSRGLLEDRDEGLAYFDRWVSEHLAEFASSCSDLKLLKTFATWGLHKRLSKYSERAPVRESQVTAATQCLRVSASFLSSLADRDRDLATCNQADLDQWFCTSPGTNGAVTSFLGWAIKTKRCRRLILPVQKRGNAPVLDQSQRLKILNKLLRPDTGRLDRRVAAMLVVLVAQPISRVVSLRVEQLHINDVELGICFGEGITPIPEPFAAMIHDLVSSRPNLNAAANQTSPWLFPGRSAGKHLCPSTLRSKTGAMGIDLVAARTAALRQLVLDCPPTVVGDLLGYNHLTVDRHAVRAGSRWASYAAIRALD